MERKFNIYQGFFLGLIFLVSSAFIAENISGREILCMKNGEFYKDLLFQKELTQEVAEESEKEKRKEQEAEIERCIEKLKADEGNKELFSAMRTLDWYGELAIDPLFEVLHDKDKYLKVQRMNAIIVLGNIGSKKAIEPLKKYLAEEELDNIEKEQVKDSLNRLEDQGVGWTSYDYKSGGINYYADDTVYIALLIRRRSYQNESLDFLSNALKAFNPGVRLDAVGTLLFNKEKMEAEKIIPLLKDEDKHVRLNSAALLAYYKDESSYNALVEALKDPYYVVRENAVKALAAIGDPLAIAHIEKLKKDPEDSVRESAKRAINILKKKAK